MRLESTPRSGSFYESFSDLIFATMAIFVLLMVVFLIQVKTEEDAARAATEEAKTASEQLEEARSDLESAKESLADAERRMEEQSESLEEERQKAKDAEAASEEAKKELADIKARNVDLVIAVDGTGSMGPFLEEIQRTIVSAAKIACRLAPRFRIGIVVYRRATLTSVDSQYTLPLLTIRPP
ncbi:MAG: hypothetical protein AAF517_16635, partial [Planctomycetota bacterium]